MAKVDLAVRRAHREISVNKKEERINRMKKKDARKEMLIILHLLIDQLINLEKKSNLARRVVRRIDHLKKARKRQTKVENQKAQKNRI